MWRTHSVILMAGFLIGFGVLPGCEDPAARKMVAFREAKTKAMLTEAAQAERAGSGKLKAAMNEIRHQWEVEKRMTRENQRELYLWFATEQRRWEMRQPDYKQRIAEELGGRPENIRPTAIQMFF